MIRLDSSFLGNDISQFLQRVNGDKTDRKSGMFVWAIRESPLQAIMKIITASMEGNVKPVNLMRPVMALLLIGFLLPHMIQALNQ